MVLRRTIKILPIPEHVINVINDWGNLQKTVGIKNKLEFWDRMKNKYDWDNEDLDVSDVKVEIKPVNAYSHITLEIPGVFLEYDLQPDEGAVQENPISTMSYLAAAAWENAGLATTPQVYQTIGVETTQNVVDLIDADDDDVEDLRSEVVHKVEAVLANENDHPKDEEDQAEEPNK